MNIFDINTNYLLIGIMLLVCVIFVGISFLKPKHNFRTYLLLAIILNTIYLSWVPFHLSHGVSGIFYVAEISLFLLTLLFGICHWSREHVHHSEHKPKGSVDVLVTCFNEPAKMIEKTLFAAVAMEYKNKKVYLLDDGNREELKIVAKKCGAHYLARKSNTHYKAGNLNFGLSNTDSDYVMTLDADQVPEKHFLDETLGHFNEGEHIAIVTTRQRFDVHEKDFNHDHMFYEHMQSGKNSMGCAISCGSGVIYKRSALEKIGGFDTWNVVEDLTTTYKLNQAGFKSIYVKKAYTTGLAPQDLKNIYKQRGTWALDSLRIFFRKNPLFVKGLNFGQRLHYLEISLNYFVGAIAIPILMFAPVFSLITNVSIINAGPEYFIIRGVGLVAIVAFYAYANKSHESNQMWAGMWPVFLKAAFLAIFFKKGRYKVTEKIEDMKRRVLQVIPQLVLVMLGIFSFFYYLVRFGVTSVLYTDSVWLILMIWWMHPIIFKGFAKQHRHTPTLHRDVGKEFT